MQSEVEPHYCRAGTPYLRCETDACLWTNFKHTT